MAICPAFFRNVAKAACLALAVFALPLAAQQVVSVTVSTAPSGARYTVDGLQYIQPTNFLWPVGSKHVVAIVSPTYNSQPILGNCEIPTDAPFTQYDPSCRTRYSFTSWETSAGGLATGSSAVQTITVDAGLRFVRANFTVQYRVGISFFDRGAQGATEFCLAKAQTLGPKPMTDGSGVVFANGVCLDGSGIAWVAPGPMTLQAVPFDGFIFRGWTFDSNPADAAQTTSIDVRGPMTINPRFEPAKRIRLYSNPLGLRLRADTSEFPSIDPNQFVLTYPIPGYFDWAGGSRHVLSGVSPQVDIDNRTWVFKDWSNGGGQNMSITVDNQTNVPLTLTANFVRGVHASFLTEPAGLRLNIDGRENWPSTNFIWGVGMKYSVTAPAEQVDLRGRKYLFKEWSNAGPTTQEIVPTDAQITPGIRLIARYEAVPQAVLQSSVPGLRISVDGAECVVPCRIDRAAGSVVKIAAPEIVTIADTSRYEFLGWSDGAGAIRDLAINADAQTLVARYRVSNRLVVVADPGEGANLVLQPQSADGFYPSDASVTITAEAKSGFKFRRWDGDLTGTFRSGAVSMSMSRVVRALLDRVPFVEPTGVRNAAADLPEPGVAGGLIAIFGGSMAKNYAVGPANPLLQTLGGTIVLVNDRLLPLVYVSPEQINAQLSSDLEPGDYKLTVRTEGMADVVSDFTIVRNAPGIFVNQVDDISFAIALHQDGSPVTAANPARADEVVNVLGTGFGPYNRRVIDGFATPLTPSATLIDPVEIVLGEARIQPTFAGAAPGFVGMTSTRFRIPAGFAGAQSLKVVVNGKESNSAVLPVE